MRLFAKSLTILTGSMQLSLPQKKAMKTIKVMVMLVILTISANAQPVLLGSINNLNPAGAGYFYHTTLALDGEKYIEQVVDSGYRAIVIYNSNCTVWKIINLNALPIGYFLVGTDTIQQWNYSAAYVSENLFTLNGEVDVLVSISMGTNNHYTCIVNDAGSIVWSVTGQYPMYTFGPGEFSPIYTKTTGGSGMILYGEIQYPEQKLRAYIYELPGVWTDVHSPLIENSGSLNPFPNPTSGLVTISYKLPNGVTTGQIILYDMSGKQLKSYQVTSSSSSLETSTLGLKSGNYLWQLKSGSFITSEKMLVIK